MSWTWTRNRSYANINIATSSETERKLATDQIERKAVTGVATAENLFHCKTRCWYGIAQSMVG